MKQESKKPKLLTVLTVLCAIFIAEATQAQTKPWVAPVTARELKNPVEPNSTTLKAAKVLYVANCAPCHGDKGKGDGPAAAALNPKPADHTSEAVQRETDGALFWKMSEGNKPMPQYKAILSPTQRWELVDYIRTLSKAGKK